MSILLAGVVSPVRSSLNITLVPLPTGMSDTIDMVMNPLSSFLE